MKTPVRISPKEYAKLLVNYMTTKLVIRGGIPLCKACQIPIKNAHPYVSIHIAEMSGCAGPGTVERPPVPYCPKCDAVPDDHGCLHVPFADIEGTLYSKLAKARLN